MAHKFSMIAGAILSCAVLPGGSAVSFAQQGSPAATQRPYRVGPFHSVNAAGPHRIVVTVGGPPSVRAEGPASELDKMEVVVEEGSLAIRPRREFRMNYRWDNHRPGTFYVSAPRLNAAAIAGSGDMKIDRVEGERFSGTLAGSGNLAVAFLRARDVRLSIAGSGNFSVKGEADRAALSVAGSGNLRLAGLATRTASVSVVGSGDIDLNASDKVSVSIMGSGDVSVTGTARCTVISNGSGNALCAR